MTIADTLENDNFAFQEINMGDYDEDDKQFMYFDIDTKKLYDMRNDNHLLQLNETAH